MANILTIDDNALALEAMKILLEESGHDVVTATNGDEGIRKVSQDTFDLVITDLIMPGKEGLETLQEIKNGYPETKVIVISGGGRSSPDLYLESAVNFGADDTLAKPFSAKELLGSIDKLLN